MGRPRFQAGIATSAPWVGIKNEIQHEFDARGNHRITYNGASGDWVSYCNIATIKIDDRLFRAYSDHFVNMNEIEEAQSVVPRTLGDCYRKDE